MYSYPKRIIKISYQQRPKKQPLLVMRKASKDTDSGLLHKCKWVVILSTATFDDFFFPHYSRKSDDKPPPIPQNKEDKVDQEPLQDPKPQEDIPVTQYYSFLPMEDRHYPNQQVSPGDEQPPDDPAHPSVPPATCRLISPAIPEPRRGQIPRHPIIMPDNAYGNHPPVEIERDLQQGGDPNWDQKLTNEEEFGDLYIVKFFNCILASTAPAFNIPKQYKNVAKLSADKQCQWRTVMQEEMDSLQDRKVWDLVNLPPGWTPVKGRWVYVVKSNGWHKACFVAKEFT